MRNIFLSEHAIEALACKLTTNVIVDRATARANAVAVLKEACSAQHQCTLKAVEDIAHYSSGFGGGEVGLRGQYTIEFTDFRRLKEAEQKEG